MEGVSRSAYSNGQRRASARLAPYTYPRKITVDARRNMMRRRRAEYLAQIDGDPTDSQRSTIEGMLRLEWAAILAEREGGLVGLREMREHRRLLEKMRQDFEASLPKPAAAAKRPLEAKISRR